MKSFQVTDFNAPLTEVDQPTPQPSGTQVLIKVKAAGVCHSDLHIWDGGYADHMTVPHPRYLLNLKGLDPVATAPYACSGVTTYSALKKVEASFNTPIVIFGAGGLGLMALSLLKAMGGKGAIVVDIDARKREAAEKASALASVDGAAPDALEQLANKAGGPIKAVLDLVGNAPTTHHRFDCMA